MSVVSWFEEIEGFVALESVEGEYVSSINTVSVEFQSHRGGWSHVFCHSSDFGDTKNTVLGSSERARIRMFTIGHELKEAHCAGRVNYFDSVHWEFVTNVIECQVDVLEEE